MIKKENLEIQSILIFLILSISVLLGFYFNEDGSGGGAQNDFNETWPYILNLKNDIFYHYLNWENIHLPLHYILISFLYRIIENVEIIRFIFCLASLSLPLIFYKCLIRKFDNLDRNNLFIFACSILLLPTFRYTAIWTNVQITAQIFFLISIFFYLSWSKENNNKINKNLILQNLFLALSVYTRQDYAIYYLFFMIIYFQKLNFNDFFKLAIFILVLAIPGIIFILDQQSVLNIKFTSKLQNFLLVNSSIMSFYLIPIFFLVAINKIEFFKKDLKFFIYSFLLFSILVFILSLKFDYNYILGGGFILKLSLILFNSNYFFYLSCIIGLVLLSYLSKISINNSILILLVIFGYGADIVYQKYFEPIFIFSLFLLMNSNIFQEFLKSKKNILLLLIFNLIYSISAVMNQIFLFSRNISLLY